MYKLRRQYTGKGTPINKKNTEPLQTKQNTITGAWWFFFEQQEPDEFGRNTEPWKIYT
jgi:hypothetical protein